MGEYIDNFEFMVEQAKNLREPVRVVIAGADVENILQGTFDAARDGFVTPILVGNNKRIGAMLERIDTHGVAYDLQPVSDDTNVVQYSIDMILAKKADVLMRGNTQTRDFLMPVINKSNHLREEGKLLTHVVFARIPNYDKLLAISDVTILVKPSVEQRVEVIKNMVYAQKAFGIEKPNIALLSLVEKPSFHMRDTVEAQTLVRNHQEEPYADCNIVGPIPYDLIVSKEAARLKNYDCEYCGEFDGIVVPDLMAGNLLIKVLQMTAGATSCGIIVGAKVPIAITSRSDSAEKAYHSLVACSILADHYKL